MKPLGWLPSLAALVAVAGVLYATHYVFVPWFTRTTGHPYLVGYLIGWVATTFLILVASLVAWRLEGHPATLASLASRFRLKRMAGRDWLWVAGVLVVVAAAYFGLGFTSRWLASIPLFAPHPAFPSELGPDGVTQLVPGVLFGMPLKGQAWVAAVYFVGWIFNVLGEEFWYRGWMLPRQELAFGRFAWLVNGTVFTFQHTMQPWNLLAILPGAWFMSFALQRRKNTWIGVVQHGVLNFGLFVHVLRGVLG